MKTQDLENKIFHLQFRNALQMSIIIISFGAIMNIGVVAFNGGKMPVKSYYQYESEKHFSYQEENNIIHPELTDRYYLFGYIWSIGDFILIFGGFMMILNILYFSFLTIRNKKKNKTFLG